MGKFFQVLQRAEHNRKLHEQISERSLPAEEKLAAKVEVQPVVPPLARERPRIDELEVVKPLEPQAEKASKLLEKVNPHVVSVLAPMSLEAERYRAVGFNIEQLHKENGLTVLAVSSPGVGDGKTTTAINIAATLAQTPDTKVLLIDLDLRRPAVAATLGLRQIRSKGVVGAVLENSTVLSEFTWKWPSLDLTILPAGRIPNAPHEVLKSPRLGELLAETRRQYDYVVIDTPPLTPFPDCKTLGQWVDGFLLVIAAHRTPRKLFDEAMNTMDHAKFVGVVFNYEDLTTHKYYSYKDYGAPRKKGGRLSRMLQRFSLFV